MIKKVKVFEIKEKNPPGEMVDKALKKEALRHFTTMRDPASFTSASTLKKHYFKKASLKQVEEVLQEEVSRCKTQTWGIDKQWQMDLIDMQQFKKHNGGYAYIMVAIDVFYRFAFAQPLKKKTGEAVTEAFKTMTIKRAPMYLQTDKGKEFLNSTFQKYLKDQGISFFAGEEDDIKCALAERMNATLQGKMWKYFDHANTYNYVDVLQDLIHSYNHTFHTTLAGRPVDVNQANSDRLFYRLYEKVNLKELKQREKQTLLKPGTKVRVLKKRKAFNRGYGPTGGRKYSQSRQPITSEGMRWRTCSR